MRYRGYGLCAATSLRQGALANWVVEGDDYEIAMALYMGRERRDRCRICRDVGLDHWRVHRRSELFWQHGQWIVAGYVRQAQFYDGQLVRVARTFGIRLLGVPAKADEIAATKW